MDYAHEGGFSAKKAGGIGLTIAVHVVVACGLLYGLQRTFMPALPPPEMKYVTPEVPPPKIEQPTQGQKHIDDAWVFQPSHQKPIVDYPPVVISEGTPTKPGPIEAGPGTDGPPVAGPAPAPAAKLESKSVISNLDACKPTYPRSSIINEESGVVRVRFEIGADSHLIGASVLRSSGYRALDNATVNALSQCQFKAALKDGVPVSSTLVTDYVWTLGE